MQAVRFDRNRIRLRRQQPGVDSRIGAFNGSVIPAYQNLFPDPTVNQMNQISNVGFQVNKAIAKQSSDIVVAFFPLTDSLTPDLQSLYLSSPAAFLSLLQAMSIPNMTK